MNKPDFDAAVKAAKEFLEQARKVEWFMSPHHSKTLYVDRSKTSARETAALKRRSMDLTNTLADLRNPYRIGRISK